jgi:hypothetical protein
VPDLNLNMALSHQPGTQVNDSITPAMIDQHYDEEKPEIKHVDEGLDGDVIMRSPFDDLTWKKTWVVFWKAALMCAFATFSAAAE